MDKLILQILVLATLFIGESFYLYSEMFVARHSASGTFGSKIFAIAMLLVMIGGMLFLLAVSKGIIAFDRNIWIIAVMSIAAIVIMEPVLAWIFFRQIPSIGAIIGFILGVIGLLMAVFF